MFWKIRPLSSFPSSFVKGMKDCPADDKIIAATFTHQAILRMQKEWRLFRFNIREQSAADLLPFETGYLHRTRIELHEGLGKWVLILNSRAREEEQEMAKVLNDPD